MCDICLKTPCYYSCPNWESEFEEEEEIYICDVCSRAFLSGDLYVKNDYGEFAHLKCLSKKELLEFFDLDTELKEW